MGFDAFPPGAAGSLGTSGVGGSGVATPVLAAPYGTSTTCGDAIVGADEGCDDGAGAALDAFTPSCPTHDQPATTGARSDRYFADGRHPIFGLDTGFINTAIQFPDDVAPIGASLFDIWGQPIQHVLVSEGASPIDEANPLAAALPDGSFAVAWSDFDGDGSDLGVALRKVNGDGSLGPLLVADSGREFSQLNPDILWTGSELVVAWKDYADAANGPDLRYRLFDAELNPLSADIALATIAVPEAAVALAPFNGGRAAAYREGSADGTENVVVRVGDAFRVGPAQGGPLDDRPALVERDATHLLLVFSEGTDLPATGTYNVPRIPCAVIDVAGLRTRGFQPLEPLDDVMTLEVQASNLSPSAERGADGKGQGDSDYADECPPGMSCSAGAPFGVAFNVCVATHCTNSVQDADETAKNCGGADCAPCP